MVFMHFHRNKYLKKLIKSQDNGFAKIITGIRRSGKSYLLNTLFRNHLISTGVDWSNIIFFDLEDAGNALLRDPKNLFDKIVETTPDMSQRYYVFLDEIQKVYTIVNPALTGGVHKKAKKDDDEVISFVDTVLGLAKRPNLDVYITGSNSKMLSKDIVTDFRDKATEIHIAPLSFAEFLPACGLAPEDAYNEFSLHGGMPLTLYRPDANDKEEYLKQLFSTTYMRDIIEHNHFRSEESVECVAKILASNVGFLTNCENIAATFKIGKKDGINTETVRKYVRAFENAFIVENAERYDIKGRKYIGASSKYFFSDIGLRNALMNFTHSDDGPVMENIIYNELRYRGYSVDVGVEEIIEKNENGNSVRKQAEVDFVATRGSSKYYIQASYDLHSEAKSIQERRPLVSIPDSFKKIIIVRKSPIRHDEYGITTMGVVEFLSDENSMDR